MSLRYMLALSIAIGLPIAACSGAMPEESSSETAAQASASAAGSGSMAYPGLYRDLRLPEMPDATLTSTGRQVSSLRDGLSLALTTTKTAAEARDYYRKAMSDLGWTEDPASARGATMNLPAAGVSFSKEGLTFNATIAELPDGTQVRLVVLER